MTIKGSVPVKAVSINKARKGRQRLTQEAKDFKIKMALKLPTHKPEIKGKVDLDTDLEIHFLFGLSYYSTSDADNFTKLAQDCIAKYLKMNDKKFVWSSQRKTKVKKGKEFIQYLIREFKESRCPI